MYDSSQDVFHFLFEISASPVGSSRAFRDRHFQQPLNAEEQTQTTKC